jgi:hypothetical protein
MHPPRMALKDANPDTQLDVDTMILDFLLYEAIHAVIDDARSTGDYSTEHRGSDMSLNLVHCKIRATFSQLESALTQA